MSQGRPFDRSERILHNLENMSYVTKHFRVIIHITKSIFQVTVLHIYSRIEINGCPDGSQIAEKGANTFTRQRYSGLTEIGRLRSSLLGPP